MITWTLCSIADAPRALAEMRRVLKPSGQLLFVEHGLAPENAGFAIARIHTGYMKGPKPMTFMYEGRATL